LLNSLTPGLDQPEETYCGEIITGANIVVIFFQILN